MYHNHRVLSHHGQGRVDAKYQDVKFLAGPEHLRNVYNYFHYRHENDYFHYRCHVNNYFPRRPVNNYFLYIASNPNRPEMHASKV